MNEVVGNGNIGKCPECGSENLSLTLETSNGFRYKCNECGETFVVNVKILGGNIKDLTTETKNDNDIQKNQERRNIALPMKSYNQLLNIKAEIGVNTLVDTELYLIEFYHKNKNVENSLSKFTGNIINVFNEFSTNSIAIFNQFYEDTKVELSTIHKEIRELKAEIVKNKEKKKGYEIPDEGIKF